MNNDLISELKEYKPLELDYNVKSAVENLKTAYWSNDTEKYAKAFTEAEQIIVNAICHYGYIVCERPQGDLKSCEALKAYVRKVLCGNNPTNSLLIRMFDEIIDNAPPDEIATKLQPNCNNLQQPQGELADEVWKLYKKHQSHLATRVIEFGDELKDLLGKYQKGGAEND